ncbi:uncharacterized protein [Typha angustifolia]|uniref:uncharacterized protein n=1 Tax=Typha angustifolia TaxID=59011 RepID=UPI003C2CC1F0
MDLKAMMDGEGWTEALHTSFLTSMEETFVREMLTCATTATTPVPEPPLDRHVPDSGTESNRRSQRSQFTRSPPLPKADQEILPGIEDSVFSNREEARKRPLSLCDVSQDQVVPKLGGKEEDNGTSNETNQRKRKIEEERN